MLIPIDSHTDWRLFNTKFSNWNPIIVSHPGRDHRGALQPGDWGQAVHQCADGAQPRQQHPGQVAPGKPHPGRPLCAQTETGSSGWSGDQRRLTKPETRLHWIYPMHQFVCQPNIMVRCKKCERTLRTLTCTRGSLSPIFIPSRMTYPIQYPV